MSFDRDVLSIPDSAAWRAGVLSERERICKLLRMMSEELLVDRQGLSRAETNGARIVLEGLRKVLKGAG